MKKENSDNGNAPKDTPKRKCTSKQVAAIIGIALLALLYISTLIAAIADSSSTGVWFRASLFATMALPFLIWIYVWMYGKLTGKRIAADPPSPSEESAAEGSCSAPEMASGESSLPTADLKESIPAAEKMP